MSDEEAAYRLIEAHFFVPLIEYVPLPHGWHFTLDRPGELPLSDGILLQADRSFPPVRVSPGSNFVFLRVLQHQQAFQHDSGAFVAASWFIKDVLGDSIRYVQSLTGDVDGDNRDAEGRKILAAMNEALKATMHGKEAPDDIESDSELSRYKTVVQATTLCIAKGGDKETQARAVGASFERCLAELVGILRSYAVQSRDIWCPSPSRQSLFPIVPCAFREFGSDDDYDYLSLLVHEGMNLLRANMLEKSHDEMDIIMRRYLRNKHGDPFFLAVEQQRSAQQSFWVEGNYQAAITVACSAGEILLNAILLFTEWEKGTERRETKTWFETEGTRKRLRTRYHASLGGNWTNGKEIVQWLALMDLRNRVVHGGYWPTQHEVEDGLDALHGIEQFLKTRLVERRSKFPKTAMLFLGQEGLVERNAFDKSMQRTASIAEADETSWLAAYQLWLNEEEMEATAPGERVAAPTGWRFERIGAGDESNRKGSPLD